MSELRAELSVRAKSDSLSLKQMTLAIRRDIESLEQKIKEDVQTLKHELVHRFKARRGIDRQYRDGYEQSKIRDAVGTKTV